MKNQSRHKNIFSMLGSCALGLTIALSPTFVAASTNTLVVQDRKTHIIGIRTDLLRNGCDVVLVFDSPLTDYDASRRGNDFVVVIANTALALTEMRIAGPGFTNPRVEPRGAGLAFSFQIDEGTNPAISQNLNQLHVSFIKRNQNDADNVAAPSDGTSRSESAGNRVAQPQPASSLLPTPMNNGSSSVAPPPAPGVAGPTSAVPDEPEPTGDDSDSVVLRDVDLTVPESPAFTVLGINPEGVVRPTTPQEFATSLLNGVDERGNFQTGLALDFVPFLTFFGNQTSLASYRSSPMERLLARTQLSFATAKGVSEADKATRLGLGLRLSLWDRADPRLDEALDACYTNAFAALGARPGTIPGETEAAKRARLLKRKQTLADLSKPCDDAARKRNWNASGWVVGFAPSWISTTGQTTNFKWNGGGFWTSLAYGFDSVSALKDSSQLIFHARYRNKEIVPDTTNTGQFFSQDSLFLGGRVRIAPGVEAKSILSFEGSFIRSKREHGLWDASSRYSLGLEQRIADKIWFSLSLGGQSGRPDDANHAFVLSSFKWGFGGKK